MKPPKPNNDFERLQELYNYQLLDTDTEPLLNDIVKLACQICKVPISLISLIDFERQWFKAQIGMDIAETSRDEAFCAYTILQDDIMIVQDAYLDDRFRDNPLVTEENGIRFYAGVPINTPNGFNLGSLCVIDRKPNTLDAEQIFALKTLANSVTNHFQLHLKIIELDKLNQLKDRIFSVLSHDLRGPLNNLNGILSLLEVDLISSEDLATVKAEIGESIHQNQDLLENLLTWASNQIHQIKNIKLVNVAEIIDNEINRWTYLAKQKNNLLINTCPINLTATINLDLLKMLLRNLIQNALKFTSQGQITCTATPNKQNLDFQVIDTGVGMSTKQVNQLFNWDMRSTSLGTNREKGAGLGLLLCKEYLDREGGSLSIQSQEGQGSIFTVSIPIISTKS